MYWNARSVEVTKPSLFPIARSFNTAMFPAGPRSLPLRQMTELPARLPTFLWFCIKPQKWLAFALVCTALFIALLRNLGGPYFFKCIIDVAADMKGQAGMLQAIAMPAAIFLGLLVTESVNFRVADCLMLRLFPAVRQRAILVLSSHLKHHASKMFQDNFAGSLSNKVFDVGNGAVSVMENCTRHSWALPAC